LGNSFSNSLLDESEMLSPFPSSIGVALPVIFPDAEPALTIGDPQRFYQSFCFDTVSSRRLQPSTLVGWEDFTVTAQAGDRIN
jgi:hypothetical protein